MASKRNSRAYTDEITHHEDDKRSASTSTPHRSRRNSNDEMTRNCRDHDDTQVKSGPAKEATGARLPNAVVVGQDMLIPEASLRGDGSPTGMSVTASHVEVSGVVAPVAGRPLNFGHVIPGVYRSSYPAPADYGYLQGLNLKTIVSLVKKEETDHDLEVFSETNGVRQIVFNMKGTKKEAIPTAMMDSILQVVLDQRNHPLLIHCNHGKHRTGCVVAVIRKTSGWNLQRVLDEYRTYAAPKIRECDVDYIQDFQVSALQTQIPGPSRFTRAQIRNFSRILAFTAVVVLVWLTSGTRFISNRQTAL